MNITAGISAVAELEVSELHCPALVLPIHIKLYKLLNLSCSKMGSAKNKKNQRVSREKFRKRLQPQCRNREHKQKENISPGCSTNPLQQLASFVKDISSHSKSCLMGNICLVKHIGMVWHLFSVRSVVAVEWRLHFQHHKKFREWVVGIIGSVMSQLCGDRCLLVVAHLKETMSTLGVPTLMKKAFVATESAIDKCWWQSLEESMRVCRGREENSYRERVLSREVPVIKLS